MKRFPVAHKCLVKCIACKAEVTNLMPALRILWSDFRYCKEKETNNNNLFTKYFHNYSSKIFVECSI